MDDDILLRRSLEDRGLLHAGEAARFRSLEGGVSSDIKLVEASGRRFVVKRALARLKVAAVWEAPVGRSATEAEWLRVAGRLSPGIAPEIIAEDRALGYFAMPYFDPASHPVWKARLLAGDVDPDFAARVGGRIATIHAAAAGDPSLAAAFATDSLFEAIRLEPYLRATAKAHPDLASRLEGLADRTAATRLTLVHGDLSPKNALIGPEGPIILDAECAWYGDPAFDLAFCLNHLLLKSVHVPQAAAALVASFDALAEAYLARVDWEPRRALSERAATLLPGLLLARIDGKSPVEYLAPDARDAVRRQARALLLHPVGPNLSSIRQGFVSFHA